MSKRKLVDVPLFPEESRVTTSASSNPVATPNSTVPSSSKSIGQTNPVVIPCLTKRRRFPKRPVCTDDFPLRVSDEPFCNTNAYSDSQSGPSSSKNKQGILKYGSNKSVRFDLPADSPFLRLSQQSSSPKSKYMLPVWPPSTG